MVEALKDPEYAEGGCVAIAKVLLVDDDEVIRLTLAALMQERGFDATTAANVREALHYIASEPYDVLLSDLHMPNPGDGLTVIGAMQHANPDAVTLLLTGFPEMEAAASAIVAQADEILIKPVDVSQMVEVVKSRLAGRPNRKRLVESVATILERQADSTIEDWCSRVMQDESLMAVPMSCELRSEHLPQMFRDLVRRLRASAPLGTREMLSPAANHHGIKRRTQGYTAAMMVEESRMLQVSIFHMLKITSRQSILEWCWWE
ncbi:response regulator [Granulicella sp. S190]|uniref:response regulator n=1 Tax=Granulicella sp. S190 TaxID=1747226 RepID=UPI0020B168B3|nr:response regulator [Granulicella sp. S190]